MNFSIVSPTGPLRTITASHELEKHFGIHINHAQTILTQINQGMYYRWFAGKKDLTVIDFGANVGLVSLYMAPSCKEIVMVEPTPSHFSLMIKLIEPHRGSCLVTACPDALTEKDEEVVFATGHATENKVTSYDGYGNGKIKVSGKPLKYFTDIAENEIDFCKVDIEGGEMKALTVENIDSVKDKVKLFFIEVHPAFGGGMEGNTAELVTRFKMCHYQTEQINFETFIAWR